MYIEKGNKNNKPILIDYWLKNKITNNIKINNNNNNIKQCKKITNTEKDNIINGSNK
jgi:hypothetical protein